MRQSRWTRRRKRRRWMRGWRKEIHKLVLDYLRQIAGVSCWRSKSRVVLHGVRHRRLHRHRRRKYRRNRRHLLSLSQKLDPLNAVQKGRSRDEKKSSSKKKLRKISPLLFLHILSMEKVIHLCSNMLVYKFIGSSILSL